MEHISTPSFDTFHIDIDIDIDIEEGGETEVPKYGAVGRPRLVEKLGNTKDGDDDDDDDGLLMSAAAVVVHAGVLSANTMSMV